MSGAEYLKKKRKDRKYSFYSVAKHSKFT
uniref:Uncharacterized protein n=1 Tax=Anguilla anguilla TaxID=7936 RepID=A0A0E9T7L2_ANGAN